VNGAVNDREDDPAVIESWDIVSPLAGLNHSTANFRELGTAERSIVNEPRKARKPSIRADGWFGQTVMRRTELPLGATLARLSLRE
jgi:hypothetical protein